VVACYHYFVRKRPRMAWPTSPSIDPPYAQRRWYDFFLRKGLLPSRSLGPNPPVIRSYIPPPRRDVGAAPGAALKHTLQISLSAGVGSVLRPL